MLSTYKEKEYPFDVGYQADALRELAYFIENHPKTVTIYEMRVLGYTDDPSTRELLVFYVESDEETS